MQENITISHLRNVNAADLSGFTDVLEDALSEQGSSPTVLHATATPAALNGAAVRIEWTGNYQFASPDQAYNFGEELTAVIVAEQLDHNALARLMAARSHAVTKGYRNALRGILNVSTYLKDGTYVPQGMSGEQYLEETLTAAVDAFPNSN